ncbi:MAG: glutamine-hydrolyzing carbamoyl-phosphate synthase small subunit [Nannocystaceae bacterium]
MQSPERRPRGPGLLALADGSIFRGVAVGAAGRARGEVVFNTAMTGYQEVLSDPSYHQQIVTFTAAHVGVYGLSGEDDESRGLQVAGVVVRDLPRRGSSWRSCEPLDVGLARRGVVAIAGVDTRRLTHWLRDRGAQAGCVAAGDEARDEEACVAFARGFAGLAGADLAVAVSRREPSTWSAGTPRWIADLEAAPAGAVDARVVVVDFGVKESILRLLVDRGLRVTVVPATASAAEILALAPDGVVLSNGPGDPAAVTAAIDAARALATARVAGEALPIFGICLGHQILCLALGAATVKMKFGHHGANHPVRELESGRVWITSQNHGFAVDPATLPASLRPSHVSLFDGSLQGVVHAERPIRTFQGHPEAGPGPHDAAALFDRFAADVARVAAARAEGRR